MLYICWIREQERGLLFRDGEFAGLLGPGRHVFTSPFTSIRVQRVSTLMLQFEYPDLESVKRTIGDHPDLLWLSLGDGERALVSVDGRLRQINGTGLHAFWTVNRQVDVERFGPTALRLEHEKLGTILRLRSASVYLDCHVVQPGHAGLLYVNGSLRERLEPGRYATWSGQDLVKLVSVDLREHSLDVDGQDIMTADTVTLRLNAHLAYRVCDPLRSVEATGQLSTAVYRSVQLALRAVVATRELDRLLIDRAAVAAELKALCAERLAELGVQVVDLGIRDIILPGEMKAILNRVMEARKAAEASLITRREEVAAARSQANTARILAENPVLMRLRELEVIERIAAHNKLSIRLSDKGLTDAITNLV